jgi:DNA repair exonuclease SbcCD ATPase subunit
MNEKHALELAELTETKDSLDLKLAEKLREIREDMESDKTEALEAATDVAKAMLTEELENLRHTHAAEVRLAVDAAITKLRADHGEESTALAAKHREELSKASADMTVLSEAHGAKTSALEIAIAEAKADLRAAEEKTKRMSEVEGLLESKSKELEEATSALAEIQTHLKHLEHEHKEMALSITKSVPPLNDLTYTD